MSGMSEESDIHDLVHAFADGELEPAEAEAFRQHLGVCAQCQVELDDILQLQALSGRLATQEAKPAPAPVVEPARAPIKEEPRAFRPAWSRRRRAGLAVVLGGALAAAFALAVLRNPGVDTQGGGHETLALAPTRSLEARLSYDGASAWRPYGVKRSGTERALELVPLSTQAKLEKAGDVHGLATTYLLRGERDSAAEYLGKLATSPDVDSDRAVVALSKGEPEQALILLEGVLEKAPGHAPALWNRGLVLRELGLELLAAESFGQVAALNEPGWSEEARERQAAMERQLGERQERWKAGRDAGTGLPMGVELQRAEAQRAAGDLAGMEATLKAALPVCEQQRLDAPCAELEQLLAGFYTSEHRLPEAREHALRGMRWARQGNDLEQEVKLLQVLGEVARFEGSLALSRAYLQEAALLTEWEGR